MTIMEMLGIPASFFVNINFKDINPIYFTLIVNFILAFILCFILKKTLIKEWNFGLKKKGLLEGLKKYSLIGIFGSIIITISFIIGLPLNNKPTIYRLLIEGIIYYIGVAIMEELYLRGLLQNQLEKWFKKPLVAIILTSILFGIGHIFGSLGSPVLTIICKVIWNIGLGIYLGSIYYKTRNLWIPIIIHFIVNFMISIVYCFSISTSYPLIALITSLVVFTILGIFGIENILKEE